MEDVKSNYHYAFHKPGFWRRCGINSGALPAYHREISLICEKPSVLDLSELVMTGKCRTQESPLPRGLPGIIMNRDLSI